VDRLRDEALLLHKPAKHLKGHGLARREYSGWRRRAVGRNEDAAVSNIEENAERCALIDYPGDRDEVVLVTHHMSEVRIIRGFASERCIVVGAVPYGFERDRYALGRRLLSARWAASYAAGGPPSMGFVGVLRFKKCGPDSQSAGAAEMSAKRLEDYRESSSIVKSGCLRAGEPNEFTG